MKKKFFLITIVGIWVLLSSYFVTKAQSYVIAKNNPWSNHWVIVWGGMPSSQYGARFMRNQVGNHLGYINVLYADYQIDGKKCRQIIRKVDPNADIKAAYGFSRGGYNAFLEIGKLTYVCLLDPLIPKNINPNIGNKEVYMVYNLSVWGSGNRSRLKKVAKILGPNKVKSVNIHHLKVPKHFFEYKYH